MNKYFAALVFVMACFIGGLFAQNNSKATRPWKGNAILGGGNICLVYSDDPRMYAVTKGKGIQHFYYKDYATDYIASTETLLYDSHGNRVDSAEQISTGMETFFSTLTKTSILPAGTKEVRCYVHPAGAAVLTVKTRNIKEPLKFKFTVILRKKIITDKTTTLNSLTAEGNSAEAAWDNGVFLFVSSRIPGAKIEVHDSVVTISGYVSQKVKNEFIISAGDNRDELKLKIKSLLSERDLFVTTANHWNKWIEYGKVPVFKSGAKGKEKYIKYYKQCLYAVKAACLNGQIPADMTGQFMTNGMPQLYPRDAMKSARVFLLTEHVEEAESIIKFWTRPDIPKKSKGEFFARYDANAKAVDGGSGARYDEPEWDANGYFILLADSYFKQKKQLPADTSFIFELADFLVSHIDKSGLLYEGGIVEWTGYLPATNMICASALNTASEIAGQTGNKTRQAEYKKADSIISASLIKMYDKKRNAYCDVRFHGIKAGDNRSITEPANDTLFLWDASANFGILWGYPDHKEMRETNNFYLNKTSVPGGGIKYFEAADNGGLSAYGGDIFFFTTAASSQYQSLYGDSAIAGKQVDWMIENANIYGLMPERIYLNGTDCSDASPLTWCNAEFAAAVLEWSKKQ